MLQTILFGFGGLKLTNEGIVQINSALSKEWKSLAIKVVGLSKQNFVIKH
jgi:hypothetical protein